MTHSILIFNNPENYKITLFSWDIVTAKIFACDASFCLKTFFYSGRESHKPSFDGILVNVFFPLRSLVVANINKWGEGQPHVADIRKALRFFFFFLNLYRQ